MTEILLSLRPEWWEKIKSGEKTVEVRKSMPQIVHMPFRVVVYLSGSGCIVGKFDCHELIKTIRPAYLVDGSCLTEAELIRYPLPSWHSPVLEQIVLQPLQFFYPTRPPDLLLLFPDTIGVFPESEALR